MKSLNSLTPAQIRILQYLKHVGAATPKQIASFLGVTPMAVHHQVAVLKEAGLLATTLERRRAGRPSCLYCLTDPSHRRRVLLSCGRSIPGWKHTSLLRMGRRIARTPYGVL